MQSLNIKIFIGAGPSVSVHTPRDAPGGSCSTDTAAAAAVVAAAAEVDPAPAARLYP